MNDYEKAIKALELARRLSLGANYTSDKEKKITPDDKLITRVLKERYQDIKDPEAWRKFGAKLIVVGQWELGKVNDKIAGKIPTTALETPEALQTWKAELEGVLSEGSQDAFRRLTTLATSGEMGATAIPPAVLKETEREELNRLRVENKEFLDRIRDLPPSDKKVISFADALDKLSKIAKKLTPQMKDVGTQTDNIYLLTEKEKQALDKTVDDFRQKWMDTNARLRGAWDKHYDTKVELDNTRNALATETVAKEDAIIKNDNLQALYTNETTELKTKIEDLNKDMDEMAINYAKTNSVREEEIKKLKKEAQEVREQLDKIRNVEKVSVEIQTKPEMVSHWVQTKLTAEQITQMEKDIEKYRDLLYQGAMEIDGLEQQITQKETKINQLKEQVKDLEPNPTERKLMTYIDYVINNTLWDSLENVKKKQNELWRDDGLEGVDWTKLRDQYHKIRYALIQSLNFTAELLEKRGKVQKLAEARNQLQTKYDMEVRSKEELVKEKQTLITLFGNVKEYRYNRKKLEDAIANANLTFPESKQFIEFMEEYRKERFWWDEWLKAPFENPKGNEKQGGLLVCAFSHHSNNMELKYQKKWGIKYELKQDYNTSYSWRGVSGEFHNITEKVVLEGSPQTRVGKKYIEDARNMFWWISLYYKERM